MAKSINWRSPKTLPPDSRLKKPKEYQKVFSEGRKEVGRYLVAFYTPNQKSFPRLGLAVGRRVGKAVTRNSLKRHIREKFRQEKNKIPPLDIVFVARSQAGATNKIKIQKELAQIFRKIESAS